MTSNVSDRAIVILLVLILLVPVVLTVLFATSGEIQPIPTQTPFVTLTQMATAKPTLPSLTPSPMFTAVNITPTIIDPTPTLETDCVPHYWAIAWVYTPMYADPGLTVKLFINGHEAVIHPGRTLLLLESKDYAYRVVTQDGERIEGWIPFYVLPVECQS